MQLHELTLTEASNGLDKKEFSSTDLFNACLKRAKKVEKSVHAFTNFTEKDGEAAAKAADGRIKDKNRSSGLDGIPVAIKDNMAISDKTFSYISAA